MQDAKIADPASEEGSGLRISLFSDLYVTELGIDYELQARRHGYKLIAGIDEVGRGCVAGPVVAAACILNLDRPLPEGLNDSKKVAPDLRERIAAELKETCVAYAI